MSCRDECCKYAEEHPEIFKDGLYKAVIRDEKFHELFMSAFWEKAFEGCVDVKDYPDFD